MSKRLFSTDKRAEAILSYLREHGVNLSAYISNSIIDETLPVYSSELRVNTAYLLDYVVDGAKDWSGNKLILSPDENELAFKCCQTLGRGVEWLRRGHHIKNCSILKEIVAFYPESPMAGGREVEELNINVQDDVKRVQTLLKEADPDYYHFNPGLGSLARDVLERWDHIWDEDDAYRIIIDLIYCDKPIGKIDPFKVIQILQQIENQFIIEAIGEKM